MKIRNGSKFLPFCVAKQINIAQHRYELAAHMGGLFVLYQSVMHSSAAFCRFVTLLFQTVTIFELRLWVRSVTSRVRQRWGCAAPFGEQRAKYGQVTNSFYREGSPFRGNRAHVDPSCFGRLRDMVPPDRYRHWGCDDCRAWDAAEQTPLCTRIRNEAGVSISTIEHLMAALAGTGVHNALIEIDGSEVPILDGSSADFVHAILKAGIIRQASRVRVIEVLEPISVTRGNATARLAPAREMQIDFISTLKIRQLVCRINPLFLRTVALCVNCAIAGRSAVRRMWIPCMRMGLPLVARLRMLWWWTGMRSLAPVVCGMQMKPSVTKCLMRWAIWPRGGTDPWALYWYPGRSCFDQCALERAFRDSGGFPGAGSGRRNRRAPSGGRCASRRISGRSLTPKREKTPKCVLHGNFLC